MKTRNFATENPTLIIYQIRNNEKVQFHRRSLHPRPLRHREHSKGNLRFQWYGLSIAEISHRSKDFQAVIDEAEALAKELLDIPEGYKVLFLGGGAKAD